MKPIFHFTADEFAIPRKCWYKIMLNCSKRKISNTDRHL